MPQDKFASTDSVTAPARDCFGIVPDDNADLTVVPKAIYIGTGGDLVLQGVDSDADVTLRNLPSGVILDIRPSAIRQAGTTAADIVGLL
ncbi:hypothetical protein [Qipengyuania nanhaisediminis]|uniref:spike base protein, RCAP_Rcc01079 family n=1 Tax=Qipengyuania nanhaisediminis TaxID=604088 RepID=UPI0038B29816